MIIKPDRFKELNDIFGHAAGDVVLARIGSALMEIMDIKYNGWALRLRSNELAVIIQNAEKETALETAKIIASTVYKIGPSWRTEKNENSKYHLTTSIGIGIYYKNGENFKEIFSHTYKIMQKVWKKGGNRICIIKNNRDKI